MATHALRWMAITTIVWLSQLAAIAPGSESTPNEESSVERAPIHWRMAPTVTHPAHESAPAAVPATYPWADAMRERSALIVRNLGQEELDRWRRGYFRGGDPGKYLLTAAMARLMLDPDDEHARQFMNDDRAPNEHYHFAALNWARYLPLFPETLTVETRQEFERRAARYGSYISIGGTENHKVMNYAACLVLPQFFQGDGRIGNRSREQAERHQREWLRVYVRNLYHHGMGEWESATYHMFCVHSLLNVYDFAPDDETRLLASAALDYLIAAYALKYTDGVLSGPSQRGYAHHAAGKITDQTGWLWWGTSATITGDQARNFRYAMLPVTSSWRPNAVLCNIATRNLPELPVSVRGSKPNYWFGLGHEPRANVTQETLHITPHYTLGSLWSGWDVHGQTVRWQLTCAGAPGPVAFTGGHPWDHRQTEGLGRYDQTAQVGGTLIVMSDIPSREDLIAPASAAFEDALQNGDVTRNLEPDPEAGGHPRVVLTTETVTEAERESWIDRHIQTELDRCPVYAHFILPHEAPVPVAAGDWWVLEVRDTFIGIHPLSDGSHIGSLPPTNRQQRRANRHNRFALGQAALIVPGHHTGFVLQVADRTQYERLDAFAAALQDLTVDTTRFADDLHVDVTTLTGQTIAMTYDTDGARARVVIDGEPVSYDDWPVFASRYVTLDDGVLTVNDGRQGYVVDFTDALPVYRAWEPPAEDESVAP